jgi:hypothetical protein
MKNILFAPNPPAASGAAPAPIAAATPSAPPALVVLPTTQTVADEAAALGTSLKSSLESAVAHLANVNKLANQFGINNAWATMVKSALLTAVSNSNLHIQNLNARVAYEKQVAEEAAAKVKADAAKVIAAADQIEHPPQ